MRYDYECETCKLWRHLCVCRLLQMMLWVQCNVLFHQPSVNTPVVFQFLWKRLLQEARELNEKCKEIMLWMLSGQTRWRLAACTGKTTYVTWETRTHWRPLVRCQWYCLVLLFQVSLIEFFISNVLLQILSITGDLFTNEHVILTMVKF